MIDELKRKLAHLTSDQSFSLILTGSVYALSARVVMACLNLATSIVIARFYGAGALGLLAMVTSLFSFFVIFAVMGTNTAILRFIPEHAAKYSMTSAHKVFRKTQNLVVALSIVISALLFFMSDILAEKFFSKPDLAFYIAFSAGFIIFKSLLDLNIETIRGLKFVSVYAVVQILPAFIFFILILGGMVLDDSEKMPVYSQFTAWAITAVIGFFIVNRAFKNKMQSTDHVHSVPVKKILSISAPMMMTASIYFFVGQVSIIILGMFKTEAEVGYYSVAVRLSTLTIFILSAVNSMAAPRFSELFHAGNMDELFHVAKKSTKLIFWATIPILLFLIVLGRPFLSFMFGQEYIIAYPAMVLLVVGQFVNSSSGSTGHFMSMTGHQKIYMNIVLIAATINVILNFLLIPNIGIIGAAFSSILAMSFMNIYTIFYIKRKYGEAICYIPFLLSDYRSKKR